ncbi:MAG: single-stranded DNA-binding protein [Streptosporangiaceae bacterium]|nr:single-stranded DNA-binding protein [Streptosporangiaceae bacterium]
MSQVGQITLVGFTTAEPKLRHTNKDKVPYAKVRVGSTTRKVDRETGEWRDADTSYYTVTCWRRLAVNVTASLRKGDPVLVKGKFQTRTWNDDSGRPRMEIEIEADTVGHDLGQGWAHFQRNPRVPPNIARDLAEGEAARHGLTPEDPGDPGDLAEMAESGDLAEAAEVTEAAESGPRGDGPLAPHGQDAPEYAGSDMFNDDALADLAQKEADGPADANVPEPVPL